MTLHSSIPPHSVQRTSRRRRPDGPNSDIHRVPASPIPLVIAGFVGGLLTTALVWWVGIGPQQTMSLYWLTAPGSDIYYVEQQQSFRAMGQADGIRASLETLIQGSADPRLTSAIPPDTQILGIRVEGDDIFLNLSEHFTSGGGSTMMLGRITQLLYTATSSNPAARLWISVNGEALNTLGGEGLIIDQPLTRASFAPNFSGSIVAIDDLNP